MAVAWEAAGGDVLRLDKFWIRPDVDARSVALYGPHAFSLVVAQVLGLCLVSPPDEVLSCAIYDGDGALREASEFVARCARELPLPETSVIDAAFVQDRGWSLLEANAAWGAGLNGCDPAAAIRCIDRATHPE